MSVPFLNRGYQWNFGTKPGATSVLVEVETDEGVQGIGEAPCLFHPYLPADVVQAFVEASRAYLVGEEPFDIERILARLYGTGAWHFARHAANWALGGIEMALWDIIGKACGQPLFRLLGGAIRKEIPFMYFIYRDHPEQMAEEAARARAEGFSTFYVKVGSDIREEISQLEAIRAAIGEEPNLRVDANEAWSPGAAVRNIKKLAKFDLEFVEQPVLSTDLEGMARVRQAAGVPICADQATRTATEVLNAIRHGAADVISFDPSDAGGILAAKKVAGITEAAGIPIFIHSNVELGVATAAHLHLAASTPNCTYANQTEYQFLKDDIIAGERLKLSGGSMKVPEGPGLGVTLNREKLEQYAEEYVKGKEAGEALARAGRITLLPNY